MLELVFTTPRFVLEVGHIGQTTKTFQVNGKSEFTDTLTANAVAVGGALTAVGTYTIDNVTSGLIRASQISVGTQSPTELASFQVGSGSDLLVVKSDGHLESVQQYQEQMLTFLVMQELELSLKILEQSIRFPAKLLLISA